MFSDSFDELTAESTDVRIFQWRNRFHRVSQWRNSSLLGSAPLEVVGSLETKPDEYAEVFYTNKTGTHQGAFRYIQSKLDRSASVNSERDRAVIAEESAS